MHGDYVKNKSAEIKQPARIVRTGTGNTIFYAPNAPLLRFCKAATFHRHAWQQDHPLQSQNSWFPTAFLLCVAAGSGGLFQGRIAKRLRRRNASHLAAEAEQAHDAGDGPGQAGRQPDAPFADLRNGGDGLRQTAAAAELAKSVQHRVAAVPDTV